MGRKACVSENEFEVWGDGNQTRSFMFIDDCVEGSIKIMLSDVAEPLNLGTDEMIDMNNFAKLAMSLAGKDLPIKNIPGPEGVRGRNSDNTMIKSQIDTETAKGTKTDYSSSEVVVQVTDTLDNI